MADQPDLDNDGGGSDVATGITSELGPVSVVVKKNGTVIATPAASAVGSFNFDAFGIGTFEITVTAVDGDNDRTGNASPQTSASRTVVVTNAPPVARRGWTRSSEKAKAYLLTGPRLLTPTGTA